MPLTKIIRRLSGGRLTRSSSQQVRDASQQAPADFPSKGFPPTLVPSSRLEGLSDQELQELNDLLPWKCFTTDRYGRRFGRPARVDKRNIAQTIPDYRTPLLDREFSLRGKHVLEIGCFEGVHTAGLALLGARVTAVDSRVENVVKTMIRTSYYGCTATVFKCDVEDEQDRARLPQVDVVHHVGVLYHLKDPVSHLAALGQLAQVGLMLDTHIARPEEATLEYRVGGQQYAYKHYREGGHSDTFSGMYDHAKWLTLDTIKSLLTASGLTRIRVAEERDERNGPRVLLFAAR